MRHFTLYFDGSCWPNPGGTAAYGFTLYEGPRKITEGHGVIDTSPAMSNNVAEMHSLYQGLSVLSSEFFGKEEIVDKAHVAVKGDSQLVINVMNKRWKPKGDKLYFPEWVRVNGMVSALRELGIHFTFNWIPREQNQETDVLSKMHLSAN